MSLSVWVGTEKGVRLAWDLVSRSRITLHFGAKAVKTKPKPKVRLFLASSKKKSLVLVDKENEIIGVSRNWCRNNNEF